VATGPMKKRLDFGGNPDHVTLGLRWGYGYGKESISSVTVEWKLHDTLRHSHCICLTRRLLTATVLWARSSNSGRMGCILSAILLLLWYWTQTNDAAIILLTVHCMCINRIQSWTVNVMKRLQCGVKEYSNRSTCYCYV